MGFQKGHKKFGGRKKGSKSKATEVRDAIERLSNGNKDFLIERFLYIYERARQKNDLKMEHAILKELMPYVYPKLSAYTVDHTEEDQKTSSTPKQKQEFIKKLLTEKNKLKEDE